MMLDLQDALFTVTDKSAVQLAACHPLEAWHCADGRVLLHWPQPGQVQVWLELDEATRQWLVEELQS